MYLYRAFRREQDFTPNAFTAVMSAQNIVRTTIDSYPPFSLSKWK